MDRSRHLRAVAPGEVTAAVVPLAMWRARRPSGAPASVGGAGSSTADLRRRAMEEAAVAAIDRILDRAAVRRGGRLPLAVAADVVRRHRAP